ncbi:MAG: DUF4423 domain-containing protein [Bdellovibrionales bacterium]|nr:DUF4423 domain-containing protein [Bdellovibrionales bacterium]
MGHGSDEVAYYSAWYWIAIHVLASIPKFQKSHAIAERLSLPKSLVEDCLERLEKMALVKCQGQVVQVTENHLHLSKDSVLISTHHSNWRLQAAMRSALREQDALQYSVVTAVSREDAQRLKNMLLDFIERSREVIGPSKEEEIIYIGLDCFRV